MGKEDIELKLRTEEAGFFIIAGLFILQAQSKEAN